MKGFKNARIYLYEKGIVTANVGFTNGVISYIGNEDVITEVLPYKEGQILVPGFIDQHIHGAFGADAMDGKVESLEKIASAIAQEGTTTFLATTMTNSEEDILNALKAVKEYKEQNPKNGALLHGIHLEGPFISPKHAGAQPKEYIAKPIIEQFEKYNIASGNNVKLVSLAPEVDGALELIDYLTKNGIVASAGHTDACYNDIEKAIKHGLKNITHTFNAQKPLHHREIGTVGSAFLFDDLNCEAICDTIHLSIPAIKLLIKNKPHDKVSLITDSMRAKYLPDGLSELGGQQVIVKDGEARLVDGTLAGSILKMCDAIKNLVLKCNVKFTDAIDFATVNPAKNLNIFDKKGSIAVGKDADITVLNEDFTVALTIREGNVVYQK